MTGSWIMRALDSTIIAYCLPTLISVSIEYQLPRLLPVLPTLRLPMSSTSFLSLLWVSLGALAMGAVAAALSSGEPVPVVAVCDWPEPATAGGADDCDCALSCARAG